MVIFSGKPNWQELNSLSLAYLGDAVYELWARSHLLGQGYEKVRELHKATVAYVRAGTQAKVLHSLWPDLDEVEQQVVLRGRNTKSSHPKNVDVVTYRHATAFEALVGYWHLAERCDRMEWAFGQIDGILKDNILE